MARELYRILDANFNRAKEGLRVCEDICRYFWDDQGLTRSYKDIRHALTRAVEALNLSKIVASRDIGADVGCVTSPSEARRADVKAVFWANSQRVKESLRVLEEVSKLTLPRAAETIKKLRYRAYALEQKAVKRR